VTEVSTDPADATAARELGAYAHGPNAAEAADRFADQIRIWDRDHRHGPGPCLTPTCRPGT
jgi:protein-L-isoaspartate(D-aspartate) O-methyltransferase